MTGPAFLVHRADDYVGVAVRQISPGEVRGELLDDQSSVLVTAIQEIPLGHKVALRDIASGADVIEYGLRIGIASTDISKGQHVHIHNIRSARWTKSIN